MLADANVNANRGCYRSFEELKEIAKSRMKFTTDFKEDATDMDFTQIDSLATASLLEVLYFSFQQMKSFFIAEA